MTLPRENDAAMKGAFITIEGIDGCGKTTCAAAIEQCLREHGIPYIRTREPGGTPMAEEIRNVVLAPRSEPVTWISEILLMYAARSQHVANTIKPSLDNGVWVISDRWTDSTFAYQCFARGEADGIDERVQLVEKIDSIVLDGFSADMTILLDVSVENAMQRTSARGGQDRFDAELAPFHTKTRQGFLHRASQYPARFAVVDANNDEAAVGRDVIAVVSRFIESRRHCHHE